MSVLTKGLAIDFEREGKKDMAITSIWPAAAIQSAATESQAKEDASELRKPTIYSDAILAMLRSPPEEVSGCLELDEDFLRKKGVQDFSKYSVVQGTSPRRIMPAEFPDLKVKEQDDEGKRVDSTKLRASKL
jgi:hypothetical protein